MLSAILRAIGGTPAMRVYGKGKSETTWREIDVFATRLRDAHSPWPFFGGTCITWTRGVIAVGWDFAEQVLSEQVAAPASQEFPVTVGGGRLHDGPRRSDAQARSFPLASEVLAHECGHTCQAIRFWPLYLLLGALFTWWREGKYWWNWFENQASELGQFGGIVTGTVHPKLWAAIGPEGNPEGGTDDR